MTEDQDLALAALAHQLADRAVAADIETEGIAQTDEHGRKWYDTRPMLDPRELPDDFIEMNRQALDYAHQRRLVIRHPQHAHLVRIVRASGAQLGLPLEEALKRAYYYDEAGQWRDQETDEWTRWHAVAKVALSQRETM